MMFGSVVTTIQAPTPSMRALAATTREHGAKLFVIGDKKGPEDYDLEGTTFVSAADQERLPFRLVKKLPWNHYARKNLGYLLAWQAGADSLFETDDDNAPTEGWEVRPRAIRAHRGDAPPWVNVYRYYTDQLVWPRGLPLDHIRDKHEPMAEEEEIVEAPIQQGLVNGSPDVDGVWRLALDADVVFRKESDVILTARSWCPFNSQCTWWYPEAFAFLYLPSHCSFRMTDIWRSFVAQRCLWELDRGVAFFAASMVQERNEHDLMRDFEDEIPGYRSNERIRVLLDELELKPGPDAVGDNLRACYRALVVEELVGARELELVDLWLEDVAALSS
jgi:hypothetical protein